MSESIGRLDPAQSAVLDDTPSAKVAAMLSKQDEIINKLNAILAAVEAATDGNSLFTGLDTAPIKAQLTKISLGL